MAAQPNTNKFASLQIVTMNELKVFILYYLGVNKSSRMDVKELWAHDFGTMLCKVTMSQRRFAFISCRIRFDDKDTWVERRAVVVLAPIHEILDVFMLNCQNNYELSDFLTMD